MAWAHRGYPMGVQYPAATYVLCTQAERKLKALQGKESRLQRRLRELAQRVTALQQRRQDAQRLAQDAKDGAQRATATSRTLSQVSPGLAAGGGGAVGSSASPRPVPPGPGAGDAALCGAQGPGERDGRGGRRGPAARHTADGRGQGPAG